MTLVTDLHGSYGRLFQGKAHGARIGLLVGVLATVPLAEMLVARLFSDLVVEGPQRYAVNPSALGLQVAVFLLVFAVTRGLHHAARAYRVRAIRRALEDGGSPSPSTRSWQWAQAFELTGILSILVQTAVFSAFFVWIDAVVGVVSLAAAAIVVWIVAFLYRRQLSIQRGFADRSRAVTLDSVGARVGTRVLEGERGALIASGALVCVLALMLWRALEGEVTAADAIVLFLGMRLLYGQLATASAALMRFARASAKMDPPWPPQTSPA